MISTRHLSALPGINELKRICQALAMLDAIAMENWEYRYYSFDAHWGNDEMLASMRNGSGDSYFILFTPVGAVIKGYAHESTMARHTVHSGRVWPGVLDHVPPEFEKLLNDPALALEETSFCIWRRQNDPEWQTGRIDFPDDEDPDGSGGLLFALNGDVGTYAEWAAEYYERAVPVESVAEVYSHKPLTPQLVLRLSSNRSLEDLQFDIAEIGYP